MSIDELLKKAVATGSRC